MSTRKSSLPRSFLLALTLAFGFGTAWFLLAIWLGETTLKAWSGANRAPYEFLEVAADGTPLIRSVRNDNLYQVTFRDLSGQLHEGVKQEDLLPATQLRGERSWRPPLAQMNWNQRIKMFMDERQPTAIWYFVHDGKEDGSGYFVGYERESKRKIGYIGLSGFRSRPVPSEDRIPVRGELIRAFEYWSSVPIWNGTGSNWRLHPDSWDLPPRLVHVPSGNQLRVVDLSERSVRTVFEAPELIVSSGVPMLSSYAGFKSRKEQPVVVQSGQKVYKLDHHYKVIGTFTIPPEVEGNHAITWYEIEGDRALVQCATHRNDLESRGRDVAIQTLYRIAKDGTIQETIEVSLHTGWPISEQAGVALTILSLPSPAFLLGIGFASLAAFHPVQEYGAEIGTVLKQSWPWLLAVLALSAVLAAIAWHQSRALGLARRERIVWAAFVLFFGVPAFAGFWLHRRWPVRERCPHCQARSPRDRDLCAACGEPFPAPSLRGNEIFA
ncbi:MAG: hypothetical protein ACP5XB_07275 [Isosphaeraceae bacterium]